MNMERFESPKSPERKRLSIETRRLFHKVLLAGDPKKISEVQEKMGWSDKKLQQVIHYQKLREISHSQKREEVKQRWEKNPKATEEEMSMGAYNEQLEPQVRPAIVNLRRKGYSTISSGFAPLNDDQHILLEQADIDEINLPVELIEKLKEQQVNIKLVPRNIVLQFDGLLSLKEIEDSWNLVAQYLPDKNKQPNPTSFLNAVRFRERQAEIN